METRGCEWLIDPFPDKWVLGLGEPPELAEDHGDEDKSSLGFNTDRHKCNFQQKLATMR
jgi:hypothetical protein